MSDSNRTAINWIGFAIAAANTALLFYLCWGLFNRQFNVEIKDPLMLVLGAIVAKHGDILQWAFGSSSQAKKQSETIDKLADTTKTAQAAALPPAPSIPVGPGESVTVTADAAP